MRGARPRKSAVLAAWLARCEATSDKVPRGCVRPVANMRDSALLAHLIAGLRWSSTIHDLDGWQSSD